jgi:hypothetical protein
MAGPSVTYTFVNGNVSDASQVNQNFTDLINGATDGTKDYNINALTCAGTATLNGNTIIGNAAGDTITTNGTFSGTGGQVSDTAPGLFPAANSSLSDATATRLGLKNYLHGTNYNGGNAPTVTLANFTVKRASFTPKQMQDGSWKLHMDVSLEGGTLSAAATYLFDIAGIVFLDTTNYKQSLSVYQSNSLTGQAFAVPNDNDIRYEHAGNVDLSSRFVSFNGEVELKLKPTWAY